MRTFGIVFFTLCLAVASFAKDPPDTPGRAADRVVAAATSGDATALKDLAARKEPDPWLVAEELRLRGKHGEALAFARAASGPDVAGLPAYLESRKAGTGDAELREAFAAARESLRKKKHADVLRNLDEASADGGGVLSVRASWLRGCALAGLGRRVEAATCFENLGLAAEKLGWLRGASLGLKRAGFLHHRAGDGKSALRCFEAREKVATRRDDPVDRAGALNGMGIAHRAIGNRERAVDCLRRSVDLYRKAGRAGSVADGLLNRAMIHAEYGDRDDAIEAYTEAYRLYERLGSLADAARCIINCGILHHEKGYLDKALEGYERGVVLARKAEAWRFLCAGLSNASRVLTGTGRLTEAQKHLDELIEVSRARKYRPFEGTALRRLGNLQCALGQQTEALVTYRAAIEVFTSLGAFEELALTHQQMGFAYHNLGDDPQAIECHERELELQEKRGDHAGMAAALNNLGIIYSQRGEHAKAREILERGLAAAERSGHVRWTANLLSNLADCYVQMLEPDRAMALNRKAYQLSLSARDWAGASSALGDVARLEAIRGRAVQAFELRRKALELAEKSKDRHHIAESLEWLASSHSAFGEYRKALALYQRARGMYQRLGARRDLAISHYFVGLQQHNLRNYVGAMLSLGRCHSEAEAIGAKNWMAWSLRSQARLLLDMKRWPQALASAEKAHAIAEKLGECETAADALEVAGDAHRKLEQPGRAEDCYRRALAIYRKLGADGWTGNALGKLARLTLDRGRHAEAAALATEAVEKLRHRSRGLGEERAAAVRERGSQAYAVGALAGVEMGDPAVVARFLEESRAAVLLESLGGREAMRRALIPADLRERERKARAEERLASAELRRVRESGRRGGVKEAEGRVATAREALFEAIDDIHRSAKAQAQIVYPRVDPLDVIRGRLRPGETLVLYSRLLSECAALVVGPKEVRIVRLGRYADVRKAADLPFEDPASKLDEGIARLQRLVVDPLALDAGVTRLLISPDRELAFLPFALLVPGREVAFVPSGTAYGLLAADRDLRGTAVLALGDPDYGVPRGPSAAPALRSGWRLGPLPRSREEAKSVGEILLIGKKATETALLDAVSTRKRWRAIHLACHGRQDANRPSLSALALTPDAERDGFLTVAEILSLRFPADLVTLSACETARGEVYRAEGVVGLTRAFLSTGAPRVLSSLWNVDDDATAALMARFYALWNRKDGEGVPAAEALMKAQEFVRGHEKWKHPHYWAAWVLWGVPD